MTRQTSEGTNGDIPHFVVGGGVIHLAHRTGGQSTQCAQLATWEALGASGGGTIRVVIIRAGQQTTKIGSKVVIPRIADLIGAIGLNIRA